MPSSSSTPSAHRRRNRNDSRVPDQAIAIDTGDPMPDGFDAVIMIEDVEKISEAEIEILKPATPWQHVRLVGEDIVATELIISENHVIRPVDMAAMIASGHTTVMVRRRPVVSIIPTGTELVEPGSELERGDIIDFNSTMLAAMATEYGAHAVRKNIVKDNAALLRQTILDALAESDHGRDQRGLIRGQGGFHRRRDRRARARSLSTASPSNRASR